MSAAVGKLSDFGRNSFCFGRLRVAIDFNRYTRRIYHWLSYPEGEFHVLEIRSIYQIWVEDQV